MEETSSSLFCSLIIALLASFTIITIYFSVVFFLRNRLLLLTPAGSKESPWSNTGVDVESPSSPHSHVEISSSWGVAGGTGVQKSAAACLSEFKYGGAFRLFPACCSFFHVGCIEELPKLHSGGRAKTMEEKAGRQEKDKIASPAGGGGCRDGGCGSWTAALFWWAAVEDCAIVI